MATAQRTAPPPAADRLDKIRDAVRTDRDLRLEIASLEEALKSKKAALLRLESEELPDLFSQASMREFTLDAERNLPAFRAKASNYYHANIAADWDEERRVDAFRWLEAVDPDGRDGVGPNGGNNPHIIKTQITVLVDRKERERARELVELLQGRGFGPVVNLAVPWNTLTAYIKELVEVKKVLPPLDKLGAQVGRIVTIKPVEEK